MATGTTLLQDARSELTEHYQSLYHMRVQLLILLFLGLELTMMMRLRDFYIMQCATASIALEVSKFNDLDVYLGQTQFYLPSTFDSDLPL